MLITTLHETLFEYDTSISATFTEARLWPVTDAHQTCHEFALTVDPLRPLNESRDYFGNLVLSFNILPPHRRVVVTSHSVVATHRTPFAAQPLPSEFEVHKAHADYLAFDGPVQNVPELDELATTAGLYGAARDVEWFEENSLFAAVQVLNTLVHERFTFTPLSTDVHTTISEVFACGHGVCQDFSHILIAVCRHAGLPARYVSGYLVTRLSRSAEGAGASHAWAEVLLPQHGWCALDPTNNLLPNDYFIKIGVGRDYRDVPPTRGIYKGRSIHSRMHVRVHTIVEDETFDRGVGAPNTDAPNEELQRELVG